MYALPVTYLCFICLKKQLLKSLHFKGRENLKLLVHPRSFVRYGNKPAIVKTFYGWTESNTDSLLCNFDQGYLGLYTTRKKPNLILREFKT